MAVTHKYQRPLFEELHFLDIHGLPFPPDWHAKNIYETPFYAYQHAARMNEG
jgi:hypothetical protein